MKIILLIAFLIVVYQIYVYCNIKSIKKNKSKNMENIYNLYIKKFNTLLNYINKDDINLNIDIMLEIHTISNFEYNNKNYNLYFKQQNKIYDIAYQIINDNQKKSLNEIQVEIDKCKDKQLEYSIIEDAYKNKIIFKYIN